MRNIVNPNQLLNLSLFAELISLNGELFVESSDGASFVLLALVCVWLELVWAAARLVVTIVVKSLLDADTDGAELSVCEVTCLVMVDPDPDTVVVCHCVIG